MLISFTLLQLTDSQRLIIIPDTRSVVLRLRRCTWVDELLKMDLKNRVVGILLWKLTLRFEVNNSRVTSECGTRIFHVFLVPQLFYLFVYFYLFILQFVITFTSSLVEFLA